MTGDKPPLLLLLHGFGADEVDLLGLASFMDKRFFVASARAPFSLSYGGYAWFEIYFEPTGISINEQQFKESREMIQPFIEELIQAHDLDPQRIYLCGFSQGSMMALTNLLSNPEKLAGLVCMSGRSSPEMLPQKLNEEALTDFPIMVTHGTLDPVLPIENGRATREFLSKLPVDLSYKEYEMGHEISPESLSDIRLWLEIQLDS